MTALVEIGRRVHARRSKMEVLLDILDAVSEGSVGPTKIMYRSNLSWLLFQESLDFLLANGLLLEELDSMRRSYRLTEKGFKVLKGYRGLREELSIGIST